MRSALPLASELCTDNDACRNVNVMADYALGVNDYTSEMREIEALADIRIVRDNPRILFHRLPSSIVFLSVYFPLIYL